jgi:hypothetical protein
VQVGETPLVQKIAAGRHKLRAVLEDGRSQVIEVDIPAGGDFNAGKLTW